MSDLINDATLAISQRFGTEQFIVLGMVAIVLLSLICGSVGALVVGNRLAFFSDALAHCAFAGVGLGLLIAILRNMRDRDTVQLVLMPLVMIVLGVVVGIGIVYVREKTDLASDTVIGVFFAAAIGFGAMLMGALKQVTNMSVENLLFGSVIYAQPRDILWLAALGIVTTVILVVRYNQLVFMSFNPSLARSRQIRVRFLNYLFIVLLGLIVNICIQTVGILLINAVLIVPAATAINLSRNLRHMFWWTILLSLASGIGGILVSLNFRFHVGVVAVQLGSSGCIILLSVLFFVVSMLVGPRLRRAT